MTRMCMENDCQSSISRLPVCFRLERLSPYKSIATSELDEERRKQTVWAAQIRRPTARVSQLLSIHKELHSFNETIQSYAV